MSDLNDMLKDAQKKGLIRIGIVKPMINRAGGLIIKGRKWYWTNWYFDQMYFDEPFSLIPCYSVPDIWLGEMFDDTKSAFLMMMPKENWN